MATYLVKEEELNSVADAIRQKAGLSTELEFPNGMITAIQNIPQSGIVPSGNKALTATTSTQTGIDVTNFATVSVAPTPSETKSVTVNGTVTPSAGKLLSSVEVNVPTSSPTQSKTLTLGANSPSTVTPDSGYTLSSVPVSIDDTIIKASNIANGVRMLGITGTHAGGINPSGNKSITATTSTQTNIDVTEFATVSVAPTPSETKSTTTNGDVTPSSGKLLSKVTVNVPTGTARSSSDLTANGATVTVPAGLYNAQATKSVSTTTHPNPTATINSSTGVVTASHTQTAGYVSAGTTTGTLNLTTQAATTITPTESSQTAVASGKYTTGAVTVAAIPSTYIGSGVQVQNFYTGTSTPASSLGSNGDIYFKTN